MKLMFENIKIALQSVKSNLLRTVLTIFIIAIGITALVGILTAIDSIKGSINDNFTQMGANTFNIRNKGAKIRAGKKELSPKAIPISLLQKPSSSKSASTLPPLPLSLLLLLASEPSNTKVKKRIPILTLREQTKTTYLHQAIRFLMEEISLLTK